MSSSVVPELLPDLLDEQQEIPKWKVISQEDGPFFRGTSKGYAGNRTSQLLGLTSVSTDPVVATIFAIQSQTRHGVTGLVHVAIPNDLAGLRFVEGHPAYRELELELRIELLPAEFSKRASITLTAQKARAILKGMGIELPATIYSHGAITETLRDTPRLTLSQIQTFRQKALKLKS